MPFLEPVGTLLIIGECACWFVICECSFLGPLATGSTVSLDQCQIHMTCVTAASSVTGLIVVYYALAEYSDWLA